ncbi:MAG: hypothetical protein ACMUIU_09450 [bacterium]
MASNFKIFVYQSKKNLTLKLVGDFDHSLAEKLIYVAKKKCNNIPKVSIYSCKKHPFEGESYKTIS